MRWTLLLLPLTAFIAGCPVPPPIVDTDSPWYRTDPVTGRGYFLYVPTTYDHTKATPVIISCHGTPPYDVAKNHIDTWRGYAEKYRCIAIAPVMDGTDGIFGDGPVAAMQADERAILSILSTLSYQYNLDRANIMLTGFSGGGFPTYWVGLRHPELFSVVVPQNSNFNAPNTDGWYPPEARSIPILIYYGENDPATIIVQSRNAIEYLRSKRFTNVKTQVISGAGHDRHPEVAMKFFMEHWKTPQPTREANGTSSYGPARSNGTTDVNWDTLNLRGPRPPAP